jgi:hypothetical protein
VLAARATVSGWAGDSRAVGAGLLVVCARVLSSNDEVFARKCGSPQLADGRPALHQEFWFQESGPVAPASASVPCAPALSERRHIDYRLAVARQFIGTNRFFTENKHTLHMQRPPSLQEPAMPYRCLNTPKYCMAACC